MMVKNEHWKNPSVLLIFYFTLGVKFGEVCNICHFFTIAKGYNFNVKNDANVQVE